MDDKLRRKTGWLMVAGLFSNGLYTFSLNGGMLVWLIAMLCYTRKETPYER